MDLCYWHPCNCLIHLNLVCIVFKTENKVSEVFTMYTTKTFLALFILTWKTFKKNLVQNKPYVSKWDALNITHTQKLWNDLLCWLQSLWDAACSTFGKLCLMVHCLPLSQHTKLSLRTFSERVMMYCITLKYACTEMERDKGKCV